MFFHRVQEQSGNATIITPADETMREAQEIAIFLLYLIGVTEALKHICFRVLDNGCHRVQEPSGNATIITPADAAMREEIEYFYFVFHWCH